MGAVHSQSPASCEQSPLEAATLPHAHVFPGVFNPHSEDPLPGQLKKQLALRIISGQQLPKPKDSMLGDRGEVWVSPHRRAGSWEGPKTPVPPLALSPDH
jgi:hypothetical protein